MSEVNPQSLSPSKVTKVFTSEGEFVGKYRHKMCRFQPRSQSKLKVSDLPTPE